MPPRSQGHPDVLLGDHQDSVVSREHLIQAINKRTPPARTPHLRSALPTGVDLPSAAGSSQAALRKPRQGNSGLYPPGGLACKLDSVPAPPQPLTAQWRPSIWTLPPISLEWPTRRLSEQPQAPARPHFRCGLHLASRWGLPSHPGHLNAGRSTAPKPPLPPRGWRSVSWHFPRSLDCR